MPGNMSGNQADTRQKPRNKTPGTKAHTTPKHPTTRKAPTIIGRQIVKELLPKSGRCRLSAKKRHCKRNLKDVNRSKAPKHNFFRSVASVPVRTPVIIARISESSFLQLRGNT